jgi:hypothetical protein
MKFKNLVCAVLLGLNVAQGGTLDKKGIIGNYSYFYTDKQSNYLQFDDKNSEFSLRIVDNDSNKETGLIRILDEKHDMTFVRKEFVFENQVKEVQLFDIADKLLSNFSNNKVNPSSKTEIYNNYIELIKSRFLKEKEPKKSVNYDFGKFFGFKPQNTLEDLIMYTYNKYNNLVRELKIKNPNTTLQNLVDNTNIIDWIKLWFLSKDYGKNLDKLGYRLERDITIEEDYIQIIVFNKMAKNSSPYLKVEINTASLPESVNLDEIRDFLYGNKTISFKYDAKGNYSYGGFKCEK